MIDDPTRNPPPSPQSQDPHKVLSPQAQRALAEAEERRAKAQAAGQQSAKELQGPKGLEPTRYGDWESKGIASDF